MDINKNDPNFLAGKELYNQMSRQMNNMAGRREFLEGFFQGLICDHRTLQQSFGRHIGGVIFKYSKLDYGTYSDARNEAFLGLCKELGPTIEKTFLPLI